MAGQLASTLRALATIGQLRERVDALAERVADLTRSAEEASARADRALQLAEAAHRAVQDADPAQALEIVTATRDEVRRLSVELTEQLNRLASA